ncbi:24640_t:CDS:1 [Dentiscutata erythropus]|uniref:24640_t:CDS:1 n=1 Tax=Dentiscutata erythropus TaxID=1348616 RepID=A0A9N9INJ3_9GLOM|nr:24640_t:CDS:1 [Dentiscutata erythropus]
MVNANEWLNQKIPKNQRAQITQLSIYKHCQIGHTTHNNGCNYCNNRNQNSDSAAPNYQFYNTTLEGELDLNDFVNLQQLYICDQHQDLNLKTDKCKSLTRLVIYNFQSVKIILYTQRLVGDLAFEKILDYQIAITKNKLMWLDLLIYYQQEVLQNDNTFFRKELEKAKNELSNVLTIEEIT